MVRGIRVASLLLFAAGTVGLSAGQQGPVKPTLPEGPDSPKVTITFPTFAASTTVTTPTVTLKGLADGADSPVQIVRWTNHRGGSGTASYDPASRAWTTAAVTTREVVNDGFSGKTNARLDTLTDPPSTSDWDLAVSTLPSKVAFIRRADGYVHLNSSSDGSNMAYIINTVEPFPGSTQTGYDVSVTLVDTSTDGDDGAALIFGYQDESNYCAVFWYGAGAETDLYLLKRSDGTLSTLGDPVNIDPSPDDVLTVEVRGERLNVKVNGRSRITASDRDCDDADRVGLGVGALRGVATDDAASAWHFDNFVVNSADPADSPVPLRRGTNIITVTATNAAGRTGTDTITITANIQDLRAPSVAFTAPTRGASHSTLSAKLGFVVSASDENGVMGCTYTCSTCAPASGRLAAALEAGTWVAPAFGLSLGPNTIVAACVDEAGNEGRATLTATRQAPVDSVAPTLTLPPSSTSSKGSAQVVGTARDNVAVTRVRWTCDRCPAGDAVISPGPNVSWTATVALAPGINVVTFVAEDARGNRGSKTLTLTYRLEPPSPQSVTLAWDWTGTRTARFRLWCNGKIVKNFEEVELGRKAMPAQSTEIRATVHGLKGALECSVTAYDTIDRKVVESDFSNAVRLNLPR